MGSNINPGIMMIIIVVGLAYISFIVLAMMPK